MSIRRILRVGMVLTLILFESVFGADDWVQTTAAVHLWPAVEGGNGHAYQAAAVSEVIPWTSADRAATLAGGYLATITSEQENQFVFGLIWADPACWRTLTDMLYMGPWLGGYQPPGAPEPAGGWLWVTGEPFDYTAWLPVEPSGPNEDRLHYMGRTGSPEAAWNDQPNDHAWGPMSYIVEYDPVTLETKEAQTIPGDAVGWTVNMGMAGVRALVLRYSNDTSRDLPVQIVVNGAVAEPNLPCAPTGAQDAWGSVTTHAYFGMGENLIELRSGADLRIGRITVHGDNTNVVLNRAIAFSTQASPSPTTQAIDGDTRTSWWIEDPPQWLEVDLGDLYPIYRTQVVSSPWQACRFRVEVKAQPEDAYRLVVDRTGNTMPGTAVEPVIDTFEPVDARYVRLTVTGADWGKPEIAEFRVAAATGLPPRIAIGSAGYRTIQEAIEAAQPGDVITLQPGRYTGAGNESILIKRKCLTLTSADPNDSRIVAGTVIVGTDAAPAVSVTNHENTNCVLAGLTISGARAGIYCSSASPTIRNCRIVGNRGPGIELYSHTQPRIRHCVIAGNRGAGILMDPQTGRPGPRDNYPQITNCTIVENLGYGIKGGNPTVVNSIVYDNGTEVGGVQINSPAPTVTYCDVQGGWPGEGNLDANPCFACDGGWVDPDDPDIGVAPGLLETMWVSGDYHLQSQAGRWDPQAGAWIVDAITSPCIDAGDPVMSVGDEPWPNGGRLNLGAYGGTREAAMSP